MKMERNFARTFQFRDKLNGSFDIFERKMYEMYRPLHTRWVVKFNSYE